MGNSLWRKHSYVRVENDHPGCIWRLWTLFHINYHPWHNVRKLLPYKKHKFNGKPSKNKKINLDEEHEVSIIDEVQEDSVKKNSASVNTSVSKNGSKSKRSIKAIIKALKKHKDNSTKSNLTVAEYKLQSHKANTKLISSLSDDLSNIKKPETKDSKKEDEFVGVLELFNVDQDLFIKFLQDDPSRNLKLVKSGTFPSQKPSNVGTTPKVEHKHTEIWPVSSNVHELRKAKSESMGKFSCLSDNNSNEVIKRHLSKSLKLMNEKEFVLWGDLQSQRSLKERLDLPEIESHLFTASEPLSRASNFEDIVESQSREFINEEQIGQRCEVYDKVYAQGGEIEVIECSIPQESPPMSNITSTLSFRTREDSQDSFDQVLMENYNQDLHYVKYVLDIAGFARLDNQKAWHSQHQPLDPALFDGVEVCCPFEPKLSNKDIILSISSSHRKMLFDLINEALVNINDRYFTCYPKALLLWCQVHCTRKEKIYAIEEVLEFVEEYVKRRPELDPLLDVAMANDLSRDKKSWVNLQRDFEGVALDLEDLIFEDLLEEIGC